MATLVPISVKFQMGLGSVLTYAFMGFIKDQIRKEMFCPRLRKDSDLDRESREPKRLCHRDRHGLGRTADGARQCPVRPHSPPERAAEPIERSHQENRVERKRISIVTPFDKLFANPICSCQRDAMKREAAVRPDMETDHASMANGFEPSTNEIVDGRVLCS